MSLSDSLSSPPFRLPLSSVESTSAPQPALGKSLQDLFEGDWYMIRSSNSFWKDKRNIHLNYKATGSHIDNEGFYQTMSSDAIKSIVGKDVPSEGEQGIFTWQGKGLLRVASARCEVLCFTSRPESGDWILAYVHKSIFTAPAVNLMCRKKGGVSSQDLELIEEWLHGVKDERFQQAVGGMVDILQQ